MAEPFDGVAGEHDDEPEVRAGGRLLASVSREHCVALSTRGLEIYSARGHSSTPVAVVDHPGRAGQADVVLLAVKCYDLAAAVADIAPIDDIRSTADFRLHVAGNVLRSFIDTLG